MKRKMNPIILANWAAKEYVFLLVDDMVDRGFDFKEGPGARLVVITPHGAEHSIVFPDTPWTQILNSLSNIQVRFEFDKSVAPLRCGSSCQNKYET